MILHALWIIDGLGPGGAESLMVPLLQNLKEYGVESRVCFMQVRAGNPIGEQLMKIGIPVDQIEIKNLRNPIDLFRIRSYIQKHRPDVVHTQLEASDIFGTLAAWLLHIPSVSTLHTIDAPTNKTRVRFRNHLRWNSLKLFSSRVIAVSQSTHSYYLKLGFTERKLLTLYNGVDLGKFSRERRSGSSKEAIFGLANDSHIVTTVAVLREPKGIQYMLHALPEMIARIPKLYYVVVGDGTYRETLEALASSLEISEHVIFMSYRSDIPEILAASDLFVLPTLLDALPTVLFESMAVGVPIVASNTGGVPEILEQDVTGILVPPADSAKLAEACVRVLCDKALAGRLSSNAHASVASRFDVRQQARSLASIYSQMVTRS